MTKWRKTASAYGFEIGYELSDTEKASSLPIRLAPMDGRNFGHLRAHVGASVNLEEHLAKKSYQEHYHWP